MLTYTFTTEKKDTFVVHDNTIEHIPIVFQESFVTGRECFGIVRKPSQDATVLTYLEIIAQIVQHNMFDDIVTTLQYLIRWAPVIKAACEDAEQ